MSVNIFIIVCCQIFELRHQNLSSVLIQGNSNYVTIETSCIVENLCKSLEIKCIFKRPAREACLCMGELPAPPAPAALPAPPAPHFVFLITL